MRYTSIILALAVLSVGTVAHAFPKKPVPITDASLRYRAVTSPTADWNDGRDTQLTFVHLSDTHVGLDAHVGLP